MSLIGMPEAGQRALMNAGVSLTRINEKAIAVDETDLATFVGGRGVSPGRGRPQGAKNRSKTSVP